MYSFSFNLTHVHQMLYLSYAHTHLCPLTFIRFFFIGHTQQLFIWLIYTSFEAQRQTGFASWHWSVSTTSNWNTISLATTFIPSTLLLGTSPHSACQRLNISPQRLIMIICHENWCLFSTGACLVFYWLCLSFFHSFSHLLSLSLSLSSSSSIWRFMMWTL